MKLNTQKRLAANVLKCSPKRIKFDPDRPSEIKEAITKVDIKGLIKDNAIKKIHMKGVSRGRARKKAEQRRKGRQRGAGSKKGGRKARLPKKRAWINKIRAQREFLRLLKAKGIIESTKYRNLYLKSKGGFFRSKRHIKLYLKEKGITKNEQK